MRDLVIIVSLIPSALILWNQPKLEKTEFWPIVRWLPIGFLFALIYLAGALVPQTLPDAAKSKLVWRLMWEVAYGYLFVAVVYVVILLRAEYGNRGWRPFWSDLKARIFGN
jgi:hypothetical protein